MGCAGSKTENPNKPGDKVKGSAAPSNSLPPSNPASAAKPQAPPKLTNEQIEQRRESMRRNLQEGRADPPKSSTPHIAIALKSQ